MILFVFALVSDGHTDSMRENIDHLFDWILVGQSQYDITQKFLIKLYKYTQLNKPVLLLITFPLLKSLSVVCYSSLYFLINYSEW